MSDISPELVDKMVTLVRTMAACGEPLTDHFIKGSGAYFAYRDAKAIAALLPEPVDPDLIEARELAIKHCTNVGTTGEGIDEYAVREGRYDQGYAVRGMLAAIKRGRELAGGK